VGRARPAASAASRRCSGRSRAPRLMSWLGAAIRSVSNGSKLLRRRPSTPRWGFSQRLGRDSRRRADRIRARAMQRLHCIRAGAHARRAPTARARWRRRALLSERHLLPPRTASTTSDLSRPSIDGRASPSRAACRQGHWIEVSPRPADWTTLRNDFRRAILAGYRRVAQRREPQSPKLRLVGAGRRHRRKAA
jgi:hypothetical protein